MPYTVEIFGSPFNDLQKKNLVSILSKSLSLSTFTASNLLDIVPCRINGIMDLVHLDSLSNSLSEAGFKIRVITSESSGYQEAAIPEGFVDFYKLLQIDQTASTEDIKKAYRKQSLKYHPDKYADSPRQQFFEEMQKSLNEADFILSNPDKKRIYDEQYLQIKSNANYIGTQQRAEEEFAIALKLLEEDNINLVLDSLSRVLAIMPSFHDARVLLANLHVELKEFAKARNTAKHLLDFQEYAPLGYVIFAQCDIYDENEGLIDSAYQNCDKAISANPTYAHAYFTKGIAMTVAGRYSSAIEFLKDASNKFPQNDDIAFALSQAYASIHDYTNAGNYLVESLNRRSDDIDFKTVASETIKEYKKEAQSVFNEIEMASRNNIGKKTTPGIGFYLFIGLLYPVVNIFGIITSIVIFAVIFAIISMVIYLAYQKDEYKSVKTYRKRKGIKTPPIEETHRRHPSWCEDCHYHQIKKNMYGEKYAKCTKMGTKIHESASLNRCSGYFFITMPIEILKTEQVANRD